MKVETMKPDIKVSEHIPVPATVAAAPGPERNLWEPQNSSPKYMQGIRNALTEYYKSKDIKAKDLKSKVDQQIAHIFKQ